MTDPAIWEKLDELEKDIKEVKLVSAILFLSLFISAAWGVIVYINLKEIIATLKGLGL